MKTFTVFALLLAAPFTCAAASDLEANSANAAPDEFDDMAADDFDSDESGSFGAFGGFIEGGLSIGTYEFEDSDDDGLDFDPALGYRLTGGVRFSPGFEVRASFVSTDYKDGDLISNNSVVGDADGDTSFSQFRVGAFYSPRTRSVVGFRVGAGYEKQSFDFEIPAVELEIDSTGYFAEGALLINAGSLITFDVGGKYLKMHTDTNGASERGDKDGIEFHTTATFHLGPVDVGAGFRLLKMDTTYDDPTGGEDYVVDENVKELFVTVAGAWGYPKSRRQ